ncbi:transposase [Streptomyces sp. NPDC001153]
MLSLRPPELHETLASARAEQTTKTWKTKYALRAGIEGTINQAVDVTGLRRARYCGLPEVRLQHAFSATVVSVIRLDAPTGTPANPPSRPGPLTRLSRQLAGRTPKGAAPAPGPRNTRLQLRPAGPLIGSSFEALTWRPADRWHSTDQGCVAQ